MALLLPTCACTVVPIPKGKNVNVADHCNYRGISSCSVFAKLFDLIFINKFADKFVYMRPAVWF